MTTRTRSNKQAALSEIRGNVSASISYGRTIVGASLPQTYKARHTCNQETEFEGSKGGNVRGNVRSDARRRKRFAFESRSVEEIARAKKTGRVYERFATIKAAASETIFQIRPRDSQGRPDVCPNTRRVSIVGKNASFCWSNERNNGLSRGMRKIVGTFCKIPTICRLLSFVVFTTAD